MSNDFAGQYRQLEHQCQIPLRSDRNSNAMAGPLTNKISDSIFASGIIVAVATLLFGCGISKTRLGFGPIATRCLQRRRPDPVQLRQNTL